jgi:hypothetical protein
MSSYLLDTSLVGHFSVHGTGTARREGSRRTHRRLRAWLRTIRDGDRPSSLHGEVQSKPYCINPVLAATAYLDIRADDSASARLDDRTCLAKNPDERWQCFGDLVLELKWIASGGSQLEHDVKHPHHSCARSLDGRRGSGGTACEHHHHVRSGTECDGDCARSGAANSTGRSGPGA